MEKSFSDILFKDFLDLLEDYISKYENISIEFVVNGFEDYLENYYVDIYNYEELYVSKLNNALRKLEYLKKIKIEDNRIIVL
jgi:hypothetical protein